MAELTISAADIEGAVEDYVSSFSADTQREEVGTVIDAGDGIAHVEGLPSVMTQELLEFPGGVLGVALNLDEHSIGAVILGDFEKIEQGQQVKRTNEVLSVPVGDAFLGRVVNPLGQPIDALGDIETDTRRALELQAPSVVQRQGVSEPLQTGIKAIDAMTPIGRGQRQLIIGDRKTGKTAVCVDTIPTSVRRGRPATRSSKCAACTSRSAKRAPRSPASSAPSKTVARWSTPPSSRRLPLIRRASNGLRRTRVRPSASTGCTTANTSSSSSTISPSRPRHTARSRWLLRRPPGREAYPGDVFYLHSRLLERCGKLNDELGAGSMTGLPIIETKANDISAYIPTNVISITDGQCFLETDLFNQGVRPAVNVGVSVSRVGGAAQIKAMKEVAGSLRLDLSQYRETGILRRLRIRSGRDVEGAAGARARLVELLKQPQYSPLSVEEAGRRDLPGHQGPSGFGSGGGRSALRGGVPRAREGQSRSRPQGTSGSPRSSPRTPRRSWRGSSTTSRRASPPPTGARWSLTTRR